MLRGNRKSWELPPRARRIQHQRARIHGYGGTTSACAENTKSEYPQPQSGMELPPRARRIHPTPTCHRWADGTTSACAENTRHRLSQSVKTRNYLRVRGEYNGAMERWDNALELPPRARRIPHALRHRYGTEGTTSACAENTSATSRASLTRWNYLRVRGEYYQLSGAIGPFLELPPRARRILNMGVGIDAVAGTTSACAENTPLSAPPWPRPWNYLRVRGEYPALATLPSAAAELPPRARRILIGVLNRNTIHGTTSACAENT